MNFFNQLINKKKRQPTKIATKVFGIGLNKTGTTSLKVAMQRLGYKCGEQRPAENLFEDWRKRNFSEIINYCKSAQFFQDIPFSLDYTYIILDQAFPNSKFILTIRDDEEQWYNSVVNFHSKQWGLDGRVPTKEDLEAANYIYKGWPWDVMRATFEIPENDPYNKKVLINYYLKRNYDVQKYFRFRKNDLLVLNLSNEKSFQILCDFLGRESRERPFPWENRTEK